MRKSLQSGIDYFDINIHAKVDKLPCTIKILLENALRKAASKATIDALINYKENIEKVAIEYSPARVLMQDFTGVPAVVDLASLRDAVAKAGGDPAVVNPKIPVDLVIDHSIQVDHYGNNEAASLNKEIEFKRNSERYKLLKWAQKSFKNFRVVPPGIGICHQVNLEYLSQIIRCDDSKTSKIAYPDTLVGTDSHTTMSGGLSVLGWGVGGLEAESVMLGEPILMPIPEVIGLEIHGKLKPGITSTDLVLTITNILRKYGVVGKFVEIFGEGLSSLNIADRATIANMAPECGSTCNFFPVDQKTLDYLDLTVKNKEQIDIVEKYTKVQGLWANNIEKEFSGVAILDLSEVTPTIAGPKRPQDKISLYQVPENFELSFPDTKKGEIESISNGSIVIAAITSCTNTSNPWVMLGAGLLARNAVKAGLKVKPWVKTSLAPGSQVVSAYLIQSGLQNDLDTLGFNVVGYGCTTCIGNSGDLKKEILEKIDNENIIAVSVLSGNRNFEGRIHPKVKANYLASPMLVVAYAIAGNVNINLTKDPIGYDSAGEEIYMSDIWPDDSEIMDYMEKFVNRDLFKEKYRNILSGDQNWQDIHCLDSVTYNWDPESTYIKCPPFLSEDDISTQKEESSGINIAQARIIAILGNSITTDHISPAGNISSKSPAATYLMGMNVQPKDFNSYGARRGNHEVMMRGTFANVRIRNMMLNDKEGGFTLYFDGDHSEVLSIYDASTLYKKHNVPLVVFAGKEYGTGSSRDWAAKGTSLLGIKAVIAQSFERIHRSNLVGMGILPLVFYPTTNVEDVGITGKEKITLISREISKLCNVNCLIEYEDGSKKTIKLQLLAKTDKEIEYLKLGNLLRYVLNENFLQ